MAATSTVHASGSFVGTAAPIIQHKPGFKPSHILLTNSDGLARLEWFEGMADDSGIKTVTAGTISEITSGGITPGDLGFTLGADADMNVAGERVDYSVWG